MADHVNFTIRKVTSFGVVTTLAGVPLQRGTSDGMGSAARFDYPTALTMGNDGNIYVADLLSGRIRKVTPSGLVTTFATGLGMPTGIATDRAGNIYVVDSVNNQVKKVTPRGVVSTLQYGVPLFKFGGYDHGAIAIDREDNIYVADAGDRTILKSGPPERFMRLSLTFDDPFRARTVITEASINFNDWVPVQTNYSAGAIVDTNSPAFSERFYRGRAQ